MLIRCNLPGLTQLALPCHSILYKRAIHILHVSSNYQICVRCAAISPWSAGMPCAQHRRLTCWIVGWAHKSSGPMSDPAYRTLSDEVMMRWVGCTIASSCHLIIPCARLSMDDNLPRCPPLRPTGHCWWLSSYFFTNIYMTPMTSISFDWITLAIQHVRPWLLWCHQEVILT